MRLPKMSLGNHVLGWSVGCCPCSHRRVPRPLDASSASSTRFRGSDDATDDLGAHLKHKDSSVNVVGRVSRSERRLYTCDRGSFAFSSAFHDRAAYVYSPRHNSCLSTAGVNSQKRDSYCHGQVAACRSMRKSDDFVLRDFGRRTRADLKSESSAEA